MAIRETRSGTLLRDDEIVLGKLAGVEIVGPFVRSGPNQRTVEAVSNLLLELKAVFEQEGMVLTAVRLDRTEAT